MNKKKDSIVIFSTTIARELFKRGYQITDIRVNNKYKDRTVFYFENLQEIKDYILKFHNIRAN